MDRHAALTKRETVAGQIMLVRFRKPSDFRFIAGQFVFITVPDRGIRDEEGLRKPFSIASTPFESELIFAVRITDSAFKRTLGEMPPGSAVTIEDAVGSFVLPDDTTIPLVFLAGGIGVAPFRSLVLQAAHDRTGHRITLFYSSRFPDEAVFLNELEAADAQSSDIAVLSTVTRGTGGARWKGLTGRIGAEMIEDRCREWPDALYYVSGPPAMVDGMRATLDGMGIDHRRIKREIWAGCPA